MSDEWILSRSNKFKHQYKQKEKWKQDLVKKILLQLASSLDPKSLGSKKKSLGFYAIQLTDSDRLAYDVSEQDHEIRLLRVCNHKRTYGKD